VNLRKKIITLGTFDLAVWRPFEPIAKRLKLPLSRLKDDLYEIQSPYFSVHIQYTKGHLGKGILATLFPTNEQPANANDKVRAFGVGVIAKYYGADMQTHLVTTEEEFFQQAEHIAKMAEMYCAPYLLGTKDDFEQIKSYVDGLIEKSGIREKKWNFPKNVREEWKLPEE
jgi:ABC-type tungstate transport system permease subunit